MQAFLLFLLVCFSLFGKTVHFSILSFNDVYEISPDKDGMGGFAQIHTLLEEERKLCGHHLTTLNGDFLFPSIYSTFDKAKSRIELLNLLGIDLVVIGNHEFDFGPDLVKERIVESKFLWLGANVFELNKQYFTGKEQVYITEVDGIKIGFFGLITEETPLLSCTERKVHFAPVIHTAKKMVVQLKEAGVDVIVALTHLLIDDDRRLAKEVPEIDVILGGHDHIPVTWYEGRTFIHKSGMDAKYLLRLDLMIEKKADGQTAVFPSWKLVLNKNIVPSPILAKKIYEIEQQFEAYSAKTIAKVEGRLDSLHSHVRSQETTMGNLAADSVKCCFNADGALIVGGIIRGNTLYENGAELTLKQLLKEFPFSNVNVLVEMKGQDLLEALENGVSQVENLAGRFPQVSGIEFICDLKQKPGNRIKDVKINGMRLNLDGAYKIATINYLLNGGDGYDCFKNSKILVGPSEQIGTVNSLIEYVQKIPVLAPKLENRIRLIR